MTKTTNFVMFFALATILLASPLATGNAYVDNIDKAEAKAAIELTRSEAALAAAIIALNVENNTGEVLEALQTTLDAAQADVDAAILVRDAAQAALDAANNPHAEVIALQDASLTA